MTRPRRSDPALHREFDAIVIGSGPSGEHCAGALASGGMDVALIERELLGGECSYWASIPSRTLLRSGEALAAAGRVPGVREAVTGSLDQAAVFQWRDQVVAGYTDASHERWAYDAGIHVLRGTGRLAGPHTVSIAAQTYSAPHVIIATGSEPAIPPIDGLRGLPGLWTTRHATGAKLVPHRLLIIGAGPTGVEMAQAFARLGSQVTLVEADERVLPREATEVSAAIEEALQADGVRLRLGSPAARAGVRGDEYVLGLADGTSVVGDRLLLATGRRARKADIGLETVGINPTSELAVDERLCVQPGLWAIGDVTGRWMLSHVGQYEGQVVADNILGRQRVARYDAVPRVVYTDPQVASIGTSEGPIQATVSLNMSARTVTDTGGRDNGIGFLKLISDGHALTGAYAVAPGASEWMQQAVVAVRASLPLALLLDVMQPSPTFAETFHLALRELHEHASSTPRGPTPPKNHTCRGLHRCAP